MIIKGLPQSFNNIFNKQNTQNRHFFLFQIYYAFEFWGFWFLATLFSPPILILSVLWEVSSALLTPSDAAYAFLQSLYTGFGYLVASIIASSSAISSVFLHCGPLDALVLPVMKTDMIVYIETSR